MGGLASLGIGSGLDANSLVQKLVNAERAGPENSLNRREASLRTSLSAFGKISSAMDSLTESLSSLKDLDSGRTARLSTTTHITATAADDAALGSYSIEVKALAQAHSIAAPAVADLTTSVGTGTLSISVAGAAATDIAIESGADTLGDVRDAINDADAGVSAAIIDDGSGQRLVLTSDETGAANDVAVTVTDDDGNNTDTSGLSRFAFNATVTNAEELTAPADASLAINGLAVTRSENSINDLIDGVTLDLKQAEVGKETELTVSRDEGAMRKALETFVEAYNDVIGAVNKATSVNEESGRGSALTGDSTARSLVSGLRRALVESGAESGDFRHLADLGVKTVEGGKLEIDDDALDAAIDSDFANVSELFVGVASGFQNLSDRFAGDGGNLDARTDGIDRRLEDVADQRIRLNQRMDQLETRLRREFGALDTLIAQLEQTGNALSSQLANLPKIGD